MIICFTRLFDFPCWIWISLGIQKLVCHLRRLPEKALALLVLLRDEMFVSLFHCLKSSRNIQTSISNSKLWTLAHFFIIKLHYLTGHFASIFQLFVATTNNSRSIIQLIISDWNKLLLLLLLLLVVDYYDWK